MRIACADVLPPREKDEKPVTREGLDEIAKALKMFGMKPLDFYTIGYLYDLELMTREFRGLDLMRHIEFRGDVLRALLRKAQFHHQQGDSFHKEVLEKMGLWRDE